MYLLFSLHFIINIYIFGNISGSCLNAVNINSFISLFLPLLTHPVTLIIYIINKWSMGGMAYPELGRCPTEMDRAND